ncbi:MAG: undecaprenyl-diphosphate phosphatase [Microbacteriaceae bacterium]|nr:undecaprenyl-diphosphate phosphatase [Actinomycetota bacterium]MCC6854856.1 undecaprenyl-diphosphate phosphatase [Microbacteriaceae bacterium]HOB57141.1 undecaprenyl-diphosphate phosphatase [Rhodoglobus sp.]HOW01630.1 undecaprenyl-diphosphate phosphatase [Rhodoglobus sp.]HOY83152.1 undecaprenyl-diphosphate phosphatase [Rhodoglobus sp.]
MGFIEAIILGLIQGLTEFLPISSSAHLRIAGEFLPSATDPGATFTAITQLGTELAVILYFRKDIVRIIGRWFRHFGSSKGAHAVNIPKDDPDVRLGWLIIIGTIPIVIIGFLAQDTIRSVFRDLWLIAIVLIVFGIILGLADLLAPRVRELNQMTYGHGIIIGLAQVLALIPGVSRSGSTMTAGRMLGYTRPAAARYGFLLAIPAVFGSGLYELVHSFGEPEGAYGYPETLVATVVAFVVGYAVIAFLMRYIEKRSFLPFVIYRILLGTTLIVLLSLGILSPL